MDRGELLAQKCSDCQTLRHPPLPMCPGCQSTEWQAQALSGRGVILTWLKLQLPGMEVENPPVGILVDLDEGLRMASNLVDGDNARVGAAVRVEFGDVNGQRLALFHTVDGE